MEVALLVSDFSQAESFLPLQHLGHLDALLSLSGRTRFDFSAPVLDLLHSGSSVSSHSVSRTAASPLLPGGCRFGSPLPVSDLLHPGLLPSSRSSVHLASGSPVFGCGQPDVSPAALDPLHLEPALPVQGFCRADFTSFVAGLAHTALAPSTRSLLQLGLSLPPLDRIGFGPSVSMRHFTCLELAFLAPGSSRSGPLPLTSEHVLLDSLTSVQSHVRSGPTVPAVESCRAGLFLSLRSLLRSELFTPVFKSVRFGLPMPPVDSLHSGASPSARPVMRPGSLFPLMSSSRLGISLPSPDYACLGPTMLLRSHARLDVFSPVLSECCLGAPLPSHSPACLDVVMLTFRISRSGTSVFVLDVSSSGTVVLLQSSVRLGPTLSAYGLNFLGSVPPALDFVAQQHPVDRRGL